MDRFAVGALVVALGATIFGCKLATTAIEDVPRTARKASRAHHAATWSGTYVFSECATASVPAACWTYEVVVNDAGMATLKVDGEQTAIHVNARPRLMKDDTLRLAFESYIDGGPGPQLFQLGPINKQGFDKGELLATMGRDRSGRMCLAFGTLESKLKAPMVCAGATPSP